MKFKENKKMQLLFCVLSVALIWGVYAVMIPFVKKEAKREKALAMEIEFDSNVLVGIDDVQENNGKLFFSGWALRVNSEITDIKVVLQESVGTKSHVIETTVSENESMKKYIEYLELEGNYSQGGFTAEMKTSRAKKNVCYEVLLYLNYTGHTEKIGKEMKVTTAKYLYNGELFDYNPTDFVKPAFLDEQMSDVVTDGKLCYYSKINGCWMYWYEDDLYWILDKKVKQNGDENPHMFFQINTSKSEKLPDYRIQYGFDNKDFYFQSNELHIDEDNDYRVASVSLQVDYPITYISTGHYTDTKELWRIRFRLPMEKRE